MKTSDVTQSVIIFVVFFLLFFSTILVVGIENVNENWETYRCNPMVMPFASLFGHDAVENFNHCTGSVQKTQLNSIMKPFNQQMNQMKDDSIQNKKASRMSAFRQFGMMSILSSLSGTLSVVAENLAVETNRGSLVVTNVLRKMGGVMKVMERTVLGLTLTAKSIKNTAKRVPGF
jgi:hypothetical protein